MPRLAVAVLALAACAPAGAPLNVERVEPSLLPQQVESSVRITGAFRPLVKVDFQRPDGSTRDAQFLAQLEQGDAVVALVAVSFVDERTLAARVPAGLAAGSWTLRVTDPSKRTARLADAVTTVDCASTRCELPDGGVVDAGPPRLDAGLADAGDEEEDDGGPPDAGPQPCGVTTLKDDDLDGYGVPGTEAMLCGAGRTMTPGDCDDVDPGVHLGAPEFCNRVDDDCDGQIDEGVCPVMNPNWIRRLDTAADKEWAAAAPFGVGRLRVVGRGDVWLRADGGFFEPASVSCPNDLRKAWAPASGNGVVVGGNPALGRISTHDVGAPGCNNTRLLSDPAAGVWGVEADGGRLVSGVLRNARLFDWVPPGQPAEQTTNLDSTPVRLEDAHRGAALLAVGSEGSVMRAYEWAPDAGWRRERLARLALPPGSLRGVWVVSATSAFAVGDEGVVLEKVGTAWRRLPAPTQAAVTSVRAFNQARVYVTTADGAVRKWNGRVWQTLYATDAGVVLNDLDGVTESDLWVVGTRGWIVHWAE